MQPGYLLTGCVQSGSIIARGVCGGALSLSCATKEGAQEGGAGAHGDQPRPSSVPVMSVGGIAHDGSTNRNDATRLVNRNQQTRCNSLCDCCRLGLILNKKRIVHFHDSRDWNDWAQAGTPGFAACISWLTSAGVVGLEAKSAREDAIQKECNGQELDKLDDLC